jgi:hypothetical protein
MGTFGWDTDSHYIVAMTCSRVDVTLILDGDAPARAPALAQRDLSLRTPVAAAARWSPQPR